MKAAVETPETNGPLTHFATTRWSFIRNRGAGGGENEGLAQLCQIYWRPIFTFIYRRGYSAQDAQDLTQDFFLVILEGTILQSADPTRGRFRSLLIKSLKNFLVDAQVTRGGQHLRGERLVDLDQVDVVDGHAGAGQRLLRRLDRAESHDLR